MKNRLISDKVRKACERESGEPFDERRVSGRSLGRALLNLGTAMESPGVEIQLRDHHYSDESQNSRVGMRSVVDVVERLHLKCINIEKRGVHYYLKYTVFDSDNQA